MELKKRLKLIKDVHRISYENNGISGWTWLSTCIISVVIGIGYLKSVEIMLALIFTNIILFPLLNPWRLLIRYESKKEDRKGSKSYILGEILYWCIFMLVIMNTYLWPQVLGVTYLLSIPLSFIVSILSTWFILSAVRNPEEYIYGTSNIKEEIKNVRK